MSTADEKRFLANVRRALNVAEPRQAPQGLFAESPSEESVRLLSRVAARTGEEFTALFARLREAAEPLNLRVDAAADGPAAGKAIARLAEQRSSEWGEPKTVAAWRHPLVESLDLPGQLAVPVFYSAPEPDRPAEEARTRLKRRIAESFIGVTAADFCLADTATLVLRTRPGQARSVSLLPSIHVAVLGAERLLADLAELYAVLRWNRQQWAEGLSTCLTLVSGPSKTADIEATLVHGAHGPRELHLIVIGGPKNS
ncbi:MAG: lactate utilization protein [Desulfobacterales bacterium]